MDYPFPTPPQPGTALEVAPGIKWLRMPLPLALDHINLWLVDGQRGCTLVDTGYGDAPTRALWQAHETTTLRGCTLVSIVVTHFHPDHVGNAHWLAQRHDAQVFMTAAEFSTGHAIHAQTSGYALSDTAALFRAHGVLDEHVHELEARGNRYRAGVPEPPARHRRLEPGKSVEIGGDAWRVIGGYGHSPEHAALHGEPRGVLISGDMLLPRISTNVSVQAVQPHDDPLGRFLESLSAFEILPDDTLVLPSHGLPFRGIAERVAQLRSHHAARLAEIVDAVTTDGVTAADMVPVLFRRELDAQQRFFAVGEAIAHLNHLVATGVLARATDDAGRVRFLPRPKDASA